MTEKIASFCEVTGASTSQAQRFLEIGGGDLDTAVMLFFESGEAPGVDDSYNNEPPQEPAHKAPNPLHAPPEHLKNASTEEQPRKKGIFGFGKPKVEAPKTEPKEASTQKEVDQPEAQEEQKPKTSQPSNIYEPDFSYKDNSKDTFNVQGGGSARDGGSNTMVYVPPPEVYNLKIDEYTNGCLIKDQFFSFEDNDFKEIYQEMREKESIPERLFDKFPPCNRPKKDQKIEAQIDTHGVDYDAEKAIQKEANKYSFNENEKGRTLDGRAVQQPQQKQQQEEQEESSAPVVHNTNFQVPGTKGEAKIKIRAKETFICTADKATRISDILNALKANGGLPGAADYGSLEVKTMEGESIRLEMTVNGAGISGKQIVIIW